MDERYMHRCLELALHGAGNVSPNPMVGAVLVKDNRIIGEGWHQQFGGPHAEVNAIQDATNKGYESDISAATMYVSLEPCSHFGKTPPCTDLIINYRIPEAVVAMKDPFQEVNGTGIEKLKAAGVKVICGVLEKEAMELNKRFIHFYTEQRPYVILKWAQTADGFMGSGNGNRLLITNEMTDRLVHKWRSEEDAIMVGTNTALQDDPSLTTRLWSGRSPIRIVIDTGLRLPSNLKIFNAEAPTIIFNNIREGQEGNLSFVQVDKEEELLPQILKHLWVSKVQSLIVEGGAKLLSSFISSGLWNEARIITSAAKIGIGLKAPSLNSSEKQKSFQSGSDLVEYFYTNR